MSDTQEKLLVVVTHGPDDVDRATIAFVMANAALAMDVDVKVILQGSGVMLAIRGMAQRVRAPNLPPLDELMATYEEQGGRLYTCTPCCKSRNIGKEDLVGNAEMVTSGFVIDETMSAKSVLSY